jgi:hypothetical protein
MIMLGSLGAVTATTPTARLLNRADLLCRPRTRGESEALRNSGQAPYVAFYLFGTAFPADCAAFRGIFYTELLPDLKRRGKTLIVISHDDRYFDVADHCIRLHAGRIVEDIQPVRTICLGIADSRLGGDVKGPHIAEPEQARATIPFVDIVRSTEKAARLGDSRWTQVMGHYYDAVRRELKTLRGKEVVTTGDGMLATFKAPVAAVRCATAIHKVVRTLGLETRVGQHAGEYKVSGAQVVGLAFHIGARRHESACWRSAGLERGEGSEVAVRNPLQGSRRSSTQRRQSSDV